MRGHPDYDTGPGVGFVVELEAGKFLTSVRLDWGATRNLSQARTFPTRRQASGAMGRAGLVVPRRSAVVIEVEIVVQRQRPVFARDDVVADADRLADGGGLDVLAMRRERS